MHFRRKENFVSKDHTNIYTISPEFSVLIILCETLHDSYIRTSVRWFASFRAPHRIWCEDSKPTICLHHVTMKWRIHIDRHFPPNIFLPDSRNFIICLSWNGLIFQYRNIVSAGIIFLDDALRKLRKRMLLILVVVVHVSHYFLPPAFAVFLHVQVRKWVNTRIM